MTMPDERTRALRWGWEYLQELNEAAVLDDKDSQCVAEILEHYPQPDEIRLWAKRAQNDSVNLLLAPELALNDAAEPTITRPARSTSETEQALMLAYGLFRGLRSANNLPEKLKRQIPYVLRHFPDEREIEWLCRTL